MPLHSVRFDDEAEAALEEVCEATGASVSTVLKRGVIALRDGIESRRPFEVFRLLDLGPGGYAKAPARGAKRAVGEVVRKKHRR
jgi:hypothetical protein